MKTDLKIGISGKDNRKLFISIYQRFFKGKIPSVAMVDNKDFPFSEERLEVPYQNEIYLDWDSYGYLVLKRDEIVLLGLYSYTIESTEILAVLEELPFEIASFGTLYPQWLNPFQPYQAPSFSNFHLPHGYACAFKADGFKRLVSRRWLDFGPWKQYRGKNDTALIQFHELNVSPEKALEQAQPGHRLMGITDEGGFIQNDYVYRFDNQGLYDQAEKKLKVIVHGQDISDRQMLDACAARLYQPLGTGMPLDNVAYIFIEDSKARQHLHDLWLRELECYAIVKGKEMRLDTGYFPEPLKPEWTIK